MQKFAERKEDPMPAPTRFGRVDGAWGLEVSMGFVRATGVNCGGVGEYVRRGDGLEILGGHGDAHVLLLECCVGLALLLGFEIVAAHDNCSLC